MGASNRPVRILELRGVRGTGGGPEKTILLGALMSHPQFQVTVCYLRDERDTIFGIDDRAAKAGVVDYVEVRERHSFDVGVWPKLRKLVREREIDLVHAHDYKTNLLALLLSRFTGVKALSTVHGWTGHSSRERWIYYPADKRVLARFPRVVAVSSEIGAELIRCGADPVRVTTVLNGIDHKKFHRDSSRVAAARAALGATDEDIVIGAVGRTEPQKRFATRKPSSPHSKANQNLTPAPSPQQPPPSAECRAPSAENQTTPPSRGCLVPWLGASGLLSQPVVLSKGAQRGRVG